ncbi:hypothetical protein L0337_23575 [candidate division KSB1 bacterium]|nr:hypothetical protein [candidate division KSB1 bacterium]
MNYLSQKEIASVQLVDVEVSEDELDVYQRCLSYILEHVDPKRLEEEFGATADEILGMVESMEDVMDRAGILLDKEEMEIELESENGK